VERKQVQVVVAYPFYDQTKRLVEAHHGQVESEEFTTKVTIQLTLTVDDLPRFESAVIELTRGEVVVEVRG
jgi:putative IMPACT (imprinted ancient) family translation regulator